MEEFATMVATLCCRGAQIAAKDGLIREAVNAVSTARDKKFAEKVFDNLVTQRDGLVAEKKGLQALRAELDAGEWASRSHMMEGGGSTSPAPCGHLLSLPELGEACKWAKHQECSPQH